MAAPGGTARSHAGANHPRLHRHGIRGGGVLPPGGALRARRSCVRLPPKRRSHLQCTVNGIDVVIIVTIIKHYHKPESCVCRYHQCADAGCNDVISCAGDSLCSRCRFSDGCREWLGRQWIIRRGLQWGWKPHRVLLYQWDQQRTPFQPRGEQQLSVQHQ